MPTEYGDFNYKSRCQVFSNYSATHSTSTTVVCSNDAMAIGAIDEARENYGLRVQED